MTKSPWNQRIDYITDRAGQEAMKRLKPFLSDENNKNIIDDFYRENPTISTIIGGKNNSHGRYIGFELYIPKEPPREGIVLLRIVMDSENEDVTYFKEYIPPIRGCDISMIDEADFQNKIENNK